MFHQHAQIEKFNSVVGASEKAGGDEEGKEGAGDKEDITQHCNVLVKSVGSEAKLHSNPG